MGLNWNWTGGPQAGLKFHNSLSMAILEDFLSLPVSNDVRMRCSPLQRPELHNRYEPSKIVYLCLLIFSIHHTRQVEKFGTLEKTFDRCTFQFQGEEEGEDRDG
jgi:hypothetical protein